MPIVVDQNPQPQPSTSESTLLDYFAVCGYDETLGLQSDGSMDPTLEKGRPPLLRSYAARILAHYPRRRVAGGAFPNEIVTLALPAGLRFCTERRKPRFPRLHNFANIREDGSRVSGAVLVYYEPVLDERLKSEMAALHVEHVRALTQSKSKEVPTISSTLPRPPRLKARDFAAGNLSAENQASDNADRRVSYYDASPQTALYVSKALCVITRIPVVSAAETLLRAIHNFLETREKPDLPLESLLYWLLQEVPLPLPGTVLRVRFSAAPFEIQLQRPNPALNELPFFDHSLRELFARVPIDKFVRVFACFLLEQQILVLSKDWRSLMLFSEALCALAFPFRWQLTYVPILPVTQLHFVEAPVPYLMGVCYGDDDLDAEDLGLGEAAAREKDAQEDGKLTRNRLSQLLSNQCVLDLETGRLEIPEDAPPLPGAKELTEKLKSVLETRLKTMECVDSTRPRARSDNQPQSARPETVLVDGRAVTLRPNRRGRGRDWAAKRQSISFDGVEESRVAADPTLEADKSAQSPGTEPSSYFADALINTSLRRQFLHLFVRLFSRYGACIIAAKRDDDEWSRSSLIPFDKTAFLADQPESSVHFLSAFLETQMFASFVDTKLWLASGAAGETNRPASIDSTSSSLSTSDVALFDALCAAARRQQSALDELGEKQNGRPLDELLDEMEAVVARRIGAGNGNFSPATDYEVSRPRSLAGALAAGPFCGVWPHLNDALLEGIDSLASPAPSPWKQRRNVPVGLRAINNRHSLHTALLLNRSSTLLPAPASGNHAANATNTSIGGNPAVETADQDQHQHHFVEQLLREAKARTKRLVLLKMDRYEAEQLGHGGAIIAGIEENTLVAGLCDLLERVFAHGLERKQGRSALWSALVQHAEMEQQQAQERQQQQQQQQQQLPPPVSSGKLDPSSRSLSSTMLAPGNFPSPLDRVCASNQPVPVFA